MEYGNTSTSKETSPVLLGSQALKTFFALEEVSVLMTAPSAGFSIIQK